MLCENLKKYRRLCGFTQDDVAKMIGLDRSAYTYYENGKTEPNVENLKKIAAMFGIDMNILLGFDAPEVITPTATLQVSNDNVFTYESNLSTEESVGKCSADERKLIAYYRVCKDKEKVLEAVRNLYEASLSEE